MMLPGILFLNVLCLIPVSTTTDCMELLVVKKNGEKYCQNCVTCGAGEEPNPPCHTGVQYKEGTFLQHCIECRQGWFKKIYPSHQPNTDNCKPCASNPCKDNYQVLKNCTKDHPDICSKHCKAGFLKDEYENCVKKPVTDKPRASTRDFTRGSQQTVGRTPLTNENGVTGTKWKGLASSSKTRKQKEAHKQLSDGAIAGIVSAVSVVVLILIVIGICWYKRRCSPTTGHARVELNDQDKNDNSHDVQAKKWPQPKRELERKICCYCKNPAEQALCDVEGISRKMTELKKHLPDEEKKCIEIYNWFKESDGINSGIKTAYDLYLKLYTENTQVTVASLLSAMSLCDLDGVVEKIHDDFHMQDQDRDEVGTNWDLE